MDRVGYALWGMGSAVVGGLVGGMVLPIKNHALRKVVLVAASSPAVVIYSLYEKEAWPAKTVCLGFIFGLWAIGLPRSSKGTKAEPDSSATRAPADVDQSETDNHA